MWEDNPTCKTQKKVSKNHKFGHPYKNKIKITVSTIFIKNTKFIRLINYPKKKKNPKTLIKEKANTIELCKTDYQSIEIGKPIIQSGCLSEALLKLWAESMEIIKTEERTLERRIERIKPKFREREMYACCVFEIKRRRRCKHI